MAPETAGPAGQDRIADTAAQRVEALRPMAESSASAYVGLIESEGAKVDPHRAFVDGFMTAIELLLTAGERQ